MAAKTIGRLQHCDCNPAVYRNPDDLVKNKKKDVHSSVRHGWRCSFYSECVLLMLLFCAYCQLCYPLADYHR